MRPGGVKAELPPSAHLIQANRPEGANQSETRHEWKEQRQISANEEHADARIDNAEQYGEQRVRQEIEEGQEIVDAFGQSVLEVGWPDLVEDRIARSGVRDGEALEVHHDAFPR
jgi:hypothetical protein